MKKVDLGYLPEKYVVYAKQSARILYWLVLLMLGLCNFLIFLALVPFMLFLSPSHLLIIFASIGLVFGLIFSFLINDIEHLQPRHHVFAALFIPAIALINITVLMGAASILNGEVVSAKAASLLYVVMFALPYMVGLAERFFRVFYLKSKI
ncbi:MAG: hypothetical protein ABIG95_05745 [Candidatus Woesearchaeota archaeon]